MFLGGVLYLHDISVKKFTGTARRNLDLFSRLCGDAAIEKVLLVTTNWEVSKDYADQREAELKSTHWKFMVDRGAGTHRFRRNWTSAWDIIDVVLERVETPQPQSDYQSLLIQMELVDRHMIIPETEAGKELRFTLKQILEIQREAAHPDALAGDAAAIKEAQEKIQKLQEQIKDLKISLPRRLRRLLHLLVSSLQEKFPGCLTTLLVMVLKTSIAGKLDFLLCLSNFYSSSFASLMLFIDKITLEGSST